MRAGGGKAKGAGFERVVCRQLSQWVTQGKKEDCFWRSAMSGGRASVAVRKGKQHARQAGDISAVAPEGHALTDVFYIECKHLAYLNLEAMLFRRGLLWDIWSKTSLEAVKYKKEPLLIARQNRWPTLLCTSAFGVVRLGIGKYVDMRIHTMRITVFEQILNMKFPL